MKFKKKEDLTKRNLIVEQKAPVFKKDENGNKTDEVRGYYLSIQVDQSLMNPDQIRSGEKSADTNPYLHSHRVNIPPEVVAAQQASNPNGAHVPDHYVSHDYYYAKSQFDRIVSAAGSKQAETPDGRKIYGVQGNLAPITAYDGQKTVILNTKEPMGPSKNRNFGPDTLDRAQAVVNAARDRKLSQPAQSMQKDMQAQAQSQGVGLNAEQYEQDTQMGE